MPRLPLRILGFIALSIAVTIASCSAFMRSAKGPSEARGTEQARGELPRTDAGPGTPR